VQGAHVSASSRTGYETKKNLALWGSFGYELDPAELTPEDEEIVRGQIDQYHKYYNVIHYGDLYRLICPWDNPYHAAWEFVSQDKNEAMATFAVKLYMEGKHQVLKLKGLDPQKFYRCEQTGEVASGALLMRAGLNIDRLPRWDGESYILYFTAV
jgi:alpha-galactosidase